MPAWLFHFALASFGLALSAAACAVVLRLWHRHPVASYRLTILVVVAALALPLAQIAVEASGLSLARLAPAEVDGAPSAPAPAAESHGPNEPVASLGILELTAATEMPDELPLLGVLLAASQGLREREEVGASWLAALGPALLAVYLAGALGMALRSVRRLARTRTLLRSARPVRDARVLRVWDEVAEGSAWRDRVRLVRSDDVRVPACFGLGTPTILLPAKDARAGRPAVLRCVLLHELLHLERRDTWVLLLQEIFRCVFWFHPAAVWLARCLDVLRETSCDLLAVERIGGRRRYATSLVEYASLLGARGAGVLHDPAILAWSSSKSQLERRIEMLLTKRTTRRARWIPIAAGMFASLWGCQLAMATTPPEAEEAETAPEAADPETAPSAPETARSRGAMAGDATLGLTVDDVGAALAAQVGRRPGEALLVTDVEAGSPARRAGVRAFDVLVAVDGKGPVTMGALRGARARVNDGLPVELTVVRAGRELPLRLGRPRRELGEPEDRYAEDPYAEEAYSEALGRYSHFSDQGAAGYRELFEKGRRYYDETDREQFRDDMRKAMERYRATLGKQGGAGSAFLDLMEQVERNPDRYLEQGRSFFERRSADDLRRALELQRSKDPAELVEREGSSLERRLRDAQERIARQQAEIDELRAALEDLRRSKSGAF